MVKTLALSPDTSRIDISTTENTLRSLILYGRAEEAARLLARNEVFSLGAGLMYEDDHARFLTKSADRTQDPDIVAIQALALNAFLTGDAERLAQMTVMSFHRNCECLFTPQESDQMAGAFLELLQDPEELEYIIQFNGTEEGEPEGHQYGSDPTYDSISIRRLSVTESSPTNSFVCAYCSPRRSCRRRAHWCN